MIPVCFLFLFWPARGGGRWRGHTIGLNPQMEGEEEGKKEAREQHNRGLCVSNAVTSGWNERTEMEAKSGVRKKRIWRSV